ncbi:MAG: DUF1990 family protein [Solirubrobacterales bacterium]|nr:DUF1990 family protein [Solirubrobacterales bacterium]
MPVEVEPRRRIATAATWPLGMAWTTWHYMWRILPVYRQETGGSLAEDLPPALPDGINREEILEPRQGWGPLLHRVYSCTIADTGMTHEELIALLSSDPNKVAPRQLARFHKTHGEEGSMRPGDEFLVHMPGPWNGPVRVVDSREDRFRFATLAGHLEAGQIEWRAWSEADGLCFAVESWARSGDRLSWLMHDYLRMAKEVQLYMWTSVVERAPRVAEGRLLDGVHVLTRRVPRQAFERG